MRMRSGGEELDNFNDLKARLETAVSSENYAEAARLRDEIQSKNRCVCCSMPTSKYVLV